MNTTQYIIIDDATYPVETPDEIDAAMLAMQGANISQLQIVEGDLNDPENAIATDIHLNA